MRQLPVHEHGATRQCKALFQDQANAAGGGRAMREKPCAVTAKIPLYGGVVVSASESGRLPGAQSNAEREPRSSRSTSGRTWVCHCCNVCGRASAQAAPAGGRSLGQSWPRGGNLAPSSAIPCVETSQNCSTSPLPKPGCPFSMAHTTPIRPRRTATTFRASACMMRPYHKASLLGRVPGGAAAGRVPCGHFRTTSRAATILLSK